MIDDIRKAVWFEMPNTFSTDDVLKRVDASAMSVNLYLSRMARAGLIYKQDRMWRKVR